VAGRRAALQLLTADGAPLSTEAAGRRVVDADMEGLLIDANAELERQFARSALMAKITRSGVARG
jgi:hypothetical protein